MTAKNQTVEMTAGDTHTVRFICTKPDGSPVNLTGGLAVMAVARNLHMLEADAVLVKSGPVDTVIVNGQTYWRANFPLVPADTVDLEPRAYMHQAEVRMSDGRVYTVAQGPFILGPSLPTMAS